MFAEEASMKRLFTIIALLAIIVAYGQPANAQEAPTPMLSSLEDLVRQEVEVSVTGVRVNLGAAGHCYNDAYASPWLIQRSDGMIVGNYVGDELVFTGFVGEITRETAVNDNGDEVSVVRIDANSSYRTEWGFILTVTTTEINPWTTTVTTEVVCK
jgi:hypothetical protein